MNSSTNKSIIRFVENKNINSEMRAKMEVLESNLEILTNTYDHAREEIINEQTLLIREAEKTLHPHLFKSSGSCGVIKCIHCGRKKIYDGCEAFNDIIQQTGWSLNDKADWICPECSVPI